VSNIHGIFACVAYHWLWFGHSLAALRYAVFFRFMDDVVAYLHSIDRIWMYVDTVAASDVISSSCAG